MPELRTARAAGDVADVRRRHGQAVCAGRSIEVKCVHVDHGVRRIVRRHCHDAIVVAASITELHSDLRENERKVDANRHSVRGAGDYGTDDRPSLERWNIATKVNYLDLIADAGARRRDAADRLLNAVESADVQVLPIEDLCK